VREERTYVSQAPIAQVMRLEAAAEARATDLIWLGIRPVYDPPRDSPRFPDMLGRMGLARA
jgi:hypothetical protein